MKRALLSRLADVCGPRTVLATTTSSLTVTDCAAAVPRPADVVGMHFFNPGAAMPLVEVVVGERTGGAALAMATRSRSGP
ncbi:3-hydroxyacyl-CoA dehydrogenase NAD-binding domain-containing protein [Aurantimonas sp. MSK8Z-1]|uniref:3-hydroxyacyl-CoA dehydrogenase NAD-binding domain-containing protein n=1 Tax=Mangrovibrevibacter kandeliae TaxID=2968473 RepID=UPI00222FD7D9|nr:3-hydroxyacyl-CoA dehydrogenase NAD-binding domain-containing protein [Aurantimonas sp. MSK8Z-1]MCW4117155.1 3-hydroxyacyl-CoA dehydrogenase NAD-binding domain-containing protein [Aurantimonas sp. MSK8Z-1]